MTNAAARSLFSAIEQETPTIGGTLWVAPFAHIDAPTEDGRVFHWEGEATQDGPIPLILDGGIVGQVSAIQALNGYLVASGNVDDSDVARRMGSGELCPIPDFEVYRTFREVGSPEYGKLHVYSPRVLAIVLGLISVRPWDDPSIRFAFPRRTIPAAVFVEALDTDEDD